MASLDGEMRLSALWVAMASWRGAAHFGKKAGRTRTEAPIPHTEEQAFETDAKRGP